MTEDNSMWSDKTAKAAVKKAGEFLEDIAGGRVTVETAFEYREDGGIRIALPQKPSKMSLKKAANMLLAQDEADQAMHETTKQIDCRPLDGAFAFDAVLKDVYGMTAIGKEIRSMFGSQPPELKTLQISPTEEVQVPFGLLEFPPLEAQFYLQERDDEDFGRAFQIYVMAKKKHSHKIRGLLMLVEAYIKEHGVYRGKALIGTGQVKNGAYKGPEFFNPYKVNRNRIVYSTDVQSSLLNQVWGIIQNADVLREPWTQTVRLSEAEVELHGDRITVLDEVYVVKHDKDGSYYEVQHSGQDIGNKVLLHGENGTGKTVAGAITAQYCLENGWSFIQARWDDNMKHVLRFAESLGTPAVVNIEDVEKLITSDPAKMDELLDQFDGMRTKGREVLLLMTSNHVGELPKSLTRAGRIDRMIYISDLDKAGVEKLINVLVPSSQREELDYEALHTAYEGFAPSWIVTALKGVLRSSIIRTGKVGQPLATADFVQCANELRAAWNLHHAATDRPSKPVLEEILRALIAEELTKIDISKHVVDLSDGEIILNA